MINEKYLHSEITSKIIQAFYTVYNHFRFGYPKSVYLRSMLIEMNNLGLICECGKKVKVYYQNQYYSIANYINYLLLMVNVKPVSNNSLQNKILYSCKYYLLNLLNFLFL